MRIDLHIHTTESDGFLTAEEVISIAYKRGINLISITDHDTTLGIEKALKIIEKSSLRIIPGVEFNTSYNDEEIHLLGYYKNIDNDRLQKRLKDIRLERTEITKNMVAKLRQNGIDIAWNEVRAVASEHGIICKAHIMYALRNKMRQPQYLDWNLIASWFRPGGLAYIPYTGNPYQEAVDFILGTGGLPVLAHPGIIKNRSLVPELLKYKPIGLEVYYGYWENQEEIISYFSEISRKSAVLSTGGSDYHGFYSPIEIGEINVPPECGNDLMTYLDIK
ncbi:MAG: hypothetical protein APF84_06165 [Gracilibacter sp. BRH_c7a]|nr:MAG: hypothetical protein APF84_06165 [Gracilibacter sp. BRH_c7a]